MDLRETFSVSIDALRGINARDADFAGVIIGSASIVLVVTVALTSKKFVLSQIEKRGIKSRMGGIGQEARASTATQP